MDGRLFRTWLLLAIALIGLPPVAWVVTAGSVRDLFPTCRGTLAKGPATWQLGPEENQRVALDADLGGFSLHLETKLANDGRVGWARLVRMENDDAGAPCECGQVILRHEGVSNFSGNLQSVADGYVYVDSSWNNEGTVVKPVARPTRHFQRSRILSPRHLPALVTLLALGALAFAIARARRGIVYVTRMATWNEGTLDADGRIETDTGERLGMLGGAAPIVAGPILISPKARSQHEAYREIPIIARSRIAFGTHAAWQATTTKSLREASTLIIMSALTTVAALAVHVLHG